MKINKTIILYFMLLFVFYSCNNSIKLNNPNMKEEYSIKEVFPKIIDEFYKINTSQEPENLGVIYHQPKYIGLLKDTIRIEYRNSIRPSNVKTPKNCKLILKKNKFSKYFIKRDWNKRQYVKIDSMNVEFSIDTTQYISNENRKSYPVIVKNISNDTLNIGYGSVIPINTEALFENGKWKLIEKNTAKFCGNGLETIILPPNEILITNQTVYNDGNYKTKLRLRIGQNKSCEFYGKIDTLKIAIKNI